MGNKKGDPRSQQNLYQILRAKMRTHHDFQTGDLNELFLYGAAVRNTDGAEQFRRERQLARMRKCG